MVEDGVGRRSRLNQVCFLFSRKNSFSKNIQACVKMLVFDLEKSKLTPRGRGRGRGSADLSVAGVFHFNKFSFESFLNNFLV